MKKLVTLMVAAMALTLTACGTSGNDKGSATNADQQLANEQLDQFQKSQPVPKYNWSQLRQNLIELEKAQADTTATTSFFFNVGVKEPITVCPSIGFPIPATYQLTNPQQVISLDTPGAGGAAVTIGQLEPTGVYTADTSGTYVICVGDDGKAYAQYWEGFVGTVSGPATWDGTAIKLTGTSSADFTTKNGG